MTAELGLIPIDAHDAAATAYCTRSGRGSRRPRAGTRGRDLCTDHRDRKAAADREEPARPKPTPDADRKHVDAAEQVVAAAKTLRTAAVELDRARARLAPVLAAYDAARRDYQAALDAMPRTDEAAARRGY